MHKQVITLATLLFAIGGVGYFVKQVIPPPKVQPPPIEAFLNEAQRNWDDSIPGSSTLAIASSATSTVAKKENAPAPGTTPLCTTQTGDFDCYDAYYSNLTIVSGVQAAFADLRARYATGYIQAQCHPLSHVIGRAATVKYATPSEAYLHGDSFCWSGYYHGVLEGVIKKIGRKNLGDQMDSICKDIPGKDHYSFDYYNCVHGLGHGVMAATSDELFDSFAYCDRLTGNWEQVSCASGAYMENVIVDGKNHFTKYLKPSDPLYPCNSSPEKYKNTCYLMQTSYMLKVNGGDFLKTFSWCANAEANYQNTCYESLGRDASGRSTSNVAATNRTCLLGTAGDQQTHCMIGAAKDFVSYFHSDLQAKELCNSFTDETLKTTCLDTVKSYYTLF